MDMPSINQPNPESDKNSHNDIIKHKNSTEFVHSDKKQNKSTQSVVIRGKLHVSLSNELLRKQETNQAKNENQTKPIDISGSSISNNNEQQQQSPPFYQSIIDSNKSYIRLEHLQAQTVEGNKTINEMIPAITDEPDENLDSTITTQNQSQENSTTPLIIDKAEESNIQENSENPYVDAESSLNAITSNYDDSGKNHDDDQGITKTAADGITSENSTKTKARQLIKLLSEHGFSLSEETQKNLIKQVDDLLNQSNKMKFAAHVDKILADYERSSMMQPFINKVNPHSAVWEMVFQHIDQTF